MFYIFFRCKNLCFQVHPPSTPPLPLLVLIYNIILAYFACCFVSAYSGFCTYACQSLFHVRVFPQMSSDPGLPRIEENGTIEAVRKRLCLILQMEWPQDVRLDTVFSLSP